MRATVRRIGFGISAAAFLTATACGASALSSGSEEPKDVVVIYNYDSEASNWVSETITVRSSLSGGVATAGGNTVVIQLRADTPIKEITIDGGFVIGGSDPIFDIDGDPEESGGGSIRIGTLFMDNVDARRLEIRDTQVVSTNMTNVVAQSSDLVLATTTVAVILVERGSSSVLSFNNFRVDRIRILGAGGGNNDTHLERLTVTNSAFMGSIRIEDAKIEHLILKNVSLEE
jgi:hypothetical protein